MPISTMAMKSFSKIASLIPKDVPVIIESSVTSDLIEEEINIALASLGDKVLRLGVGHFKWEESELTLTNMQRPCQTPCVLVFCTS